MTLQKAIEIVASLVDDSVSIPDPDLNRAMKLLIEAGKRVKVARLRKEPAWGSLLSGETED